MSRVLPAHAARRPGRSGRVAALAVLAALVAGCAGVSDRVILLPQPDGAPSAVEVGADGQRVLLARPYAVAERQGGTLRVGSTTAAEVAQRYGPLLAQLPPRPQRFVVRFESNGSRLTPEAAPVLDALRAALAQAPAPEVVVTGHTDRVGTVEANDRLSLARAQAVRDILIAAGVPPAAIAVVGRGEREPEVTTDDEVAEARNRRVEIKLR